MIKKSFLSLFMTLLSFNAIAAEEPIRITFGGPGLAREFESKQAEIEKAIGGKVEIKVMPQKAAITALEHGAIDIVSGSLSAEDLKDREAVEFRRLPMYFGVNPANEVKALTEQQAKDILTGKIKTWESITGKNIPVTVFVAKNYANSNRAILEKHKIGKDSLVAQEVVDKDGLIRRIQMDPGGIGLFPSQEKTATFSPAYFPAGTELVLSLLMKKNISERGRKLVEYIKNSK